jgi:very-short-patch-repair endonuclease
MTDERTPAQIAWQRAEASNRRERLVEHLLSDIRALGLPMPERECRFHAPRRWRFDLAWPSRALAVEVDGGQWVTSRHRTGLGYERDCEKLNAAVLLGWRVLRVTTNMVRDGRAVAVVAEALTAALRREGGRA